MTMLLASTTMPPPSCLRSRRTISAGWSAMMRELCHPVPLAVRETTARRLYHPRPATR